MNPTTSELLVGALVALSEPPPPESMGEFAAGKLSVVGLIAFLCAQEAEKGAAVRVAENQAMRALFTEAAREGWAAGQGAALAELAETRDDDLTLSGLDRANAVLRIALIALQTAVEDDPRPVARTRERQIMTLLLDAARARSLTLPGQPDTA